MYPHKKITHLQVLKELDSLTVNNEYKEDIRQDIKNPLGTFMGSWKGYVAQQKIPFPLLQTTKNLTWKFLGKRMAMAFGPQSDDNIRYVFRILEDDYNKKKK